MLALALTQIPPSFSLASSDSSDFKKNGDTLISYTGTASVVSVPNGIKTIGTDAFAGNQFLTSVQLPSSVETIENGAFRNCTSLQEITFPGGLTRVESGAFAMCDSLAKVTFSPALYVLGAGVFSGDAALKSVNLGKNNNFTILDGALYNRDKTKLLQVFSGRSQDTFTMPDSVKDIDRYAFWGCKNLKKVVLSSNLTEIPEYSFSNCSKLASVTVPYSVTRIAAKAFEDCGSLTGIFLPVSVTDIHATAFDGCYQLQIQAEEGTTAYEFAQTFVASIADQMERDSVSENALPFDRNTHIESQEQDTVQKTDTVSEDSQGFDPKNPADVSKLDVSDYYAQDTSDVIGRTRVVGGNAVVFYNDSSTAEMTGDGTVSQNDVTDMQPDQTICDNASHTIARKAYYQNQQLGSVAIENGIESIGDFAFARSAVTAISLPDGLAHIGYGAFYHCDNLENVQIPSSVTEIEPDAFTNTPYMTNWKNDPSSDAFLIVGDGILIGYKGTGSSVYLPEGVKKIAGSVFKNHTEMTDLYLPDSLTEIGEEACYGCTSLMHVSGGKHVVKICDRAFALCPLADLTIGAPVTEIGLGAYKLVSADAVVFTSETALPGSSYEKTATRLENDNYRILTFDSVNVAVIKSPYMQLEDTVLDPNYLGFRGLVISVLSDGQPGKAVLVSCTCLPDEKTGLVQLPSTVRAGGKTYELTSALPSAFSAYRDFDMWGEGPLADILLPPSLGSISQYEPELRLRSATASSAAESEQTTDQSTAQEANTASDQSNAQGTSSETGQGTELVQTTDQNSGYSNAELITAECLDDTNSYYLSVSKDVASQQTLEDAVSQTYGPLVDGQLNMFDLTMFEQKSKVPITNFGNFPVQVSVPVSAALAEQDICVVTLKDDGSLQTIYGTKDKKDDLDYFTFRTNHFSSYGIYAGIGDQAAKIRAESSKQTLKDASPETGDYFEPKWLLALASLLLGAALLINLPALKKQKENK